MSIAQALSIMLMMPDPAGYIRLRDDVITTFISECAERGGPVLDAGELLLQYKASLFSTAFCKIIGFMVDMYFRFSEEEYRTMADRFDTRLQESRLAAAIIWLDNLLREWLDDLTPGDACRQIVAATALEEVVT